MKNSLLYTMSIGFIIFIFGCSEQAPLEPITKKAGPTPTNVVQNDSLERPSVKVMTWNIYVGANVDIVLGATNLDDLALRVAAAYDTVYQTNFNERAMAIARIIKKNRPHLIGLQEVSLIQRLDQPGGSVQDELDYLTILMNALAAQHLNYQLADIIHNADVTMPRFAGLSGGVPLIDYVRLRDSDAILVRNDVQFSDPVKGNYTAALPVPDLGISIPRGYVSVAAHIANRSYRFITTHLEAFSEQIRLPQAQELAFTFASNTLPMIIVGDFNTLNPAGMNPFEDNTYKFLTDTAGFVDSWVHNLYGNQGSGYTSPFQSNLLDPMANLYQRIDLILVGNYGPPAGKHLIGPVRAEVVGDEQRDRTPSGLWPSDHAGVTANLHLSVNKTTRALNGSAEIEMGQE